MGEGSCSNAFTTVRGSNAFNETKSAGKKEEVGHLHEQRDDAMQPILISCSK